MIKFEMCKNILIFFEKKMVKGVGQSDKSDWSDWSDRSDKSDRSDRSDKSDEKGLMAEKKLGYLKSRCTKTG